MKKFILALIPALLLTSTLLSGCTEESKLDEPVCQKAICPQTPTVSDEKMQDMTSSMMMLIKQTQIENKELKKEIAELQEKINLKQKVGSEELNQMMDVMMTMLKKSDDANIKLKKQVVELRKQIAELQSK